MPEVRYVNPRDVYVEPHQFTRGELFVSQTPLLDELRPSERSESIVHIARMLVAVEVAIFDSENGTMHAQTLGCKFANGDKKTIVVYGTKTANGVELEVGLIDTDIIDQSFD